MVGRIVNSNASRVRLIEWRFEIGIGRVKVMKFITGVALRHLRRRTQIGCIDVDADMFEKEQVGRPGGSKGSQDNVERRKNGEDGQWRIT